VFTLLKLRNIDIKNRIFRSATFEGCGNKNGEPGATLGALYANLARGGVGGLITGAVYVSLEGRLMQKGACGMDRDEQIKSWREIVRRTKDAGTDVKIFMQLVHAGRQTLREVTGQDVVGASSKKCGYFREKVRPLGEDDVRAVIQCFAEASRRAKDAGFDGVQIHAAHGYLIHQFLSPQTNNRRDCWGDRDLFLEEIVRAVKNVCGVAFPVFVKISESEDVTPGIRLEDTVRTIRRLKSLGVDAWEISYGSMGFALNVSRGACPMDVVFKVNPLFSNVPIWLRSLWKMFFLKRYTKRFIPFSEGYNVVAATEIKRRTGEPVFVVGGLRSVDELNDCITLHGLDGVSLCRPLICDPDWPKKLRGGLVKKSMCTQCNLCFINRDGSDPLKCYRRAL